MNNISNIDSLVKNLAKALQNQKFTCSCAESCTGGLIGAHLTSIAGSSAWFLGGIIAYSNSAKMNLLKVNPQTLDNYGAVSQQTVIEMANAANTAFSTNLALAVSGIAGPDGGSLEKPVGTVCIGLSLNQKSSATTHIFLGNRERIRLATVQTCLEKALELLDK